MARVSHGVWHILHASPLSRSQICARREHHWSCRLSAVVEHRLLVYSRFPFVSMIRRCFGQQATSPLDPLHVVACSFSNTLFFLYFLFFCRPLYQGLSAVFYSSLVRLARLCGQSHACFGHAGLRNVSNGKRIVNLYPWSSMDGLWTCSLALFRQLSL